MAIPELRFKKEDGTEYPAWEEKKLGDLGSFIRGLSYDKNDVTDDKTKTLVLRSNNIIVGGVADCENGLQYVTKRPSPEQLLQKEDVIICLANGSDSLVGKTCSYNGNYSGPVTVGAFCGIYRCQSPIMHYLVQTENYRRKIIVIKQGGNGSLANLYGNDILTLSFLMPSCLEEQQKIAAFLSNLDAVISASEAEVAALEQQKKGAMQKIFSQETRFRRDDGTEYPAWNYLPMDKVFTEIIDKNHPDLPVLSVQQGVGTILRDKSDRRIEYDKKNLSGYKAMKPGDFIIHLRTFEGGLECANHEGISSPAYRILRSNIINSTVYRYYFRSYDFIVGKLSVAVVGIRDGKSIDMDTFWQIIIPVPCSEEQQKIADFLSSFDKAIALVRQELEKWKLLKKGLMQQMFV